MKWGLLKPVLETERLLLHHFTADHANAMEAVFCDAEVMRFGDGVQTPDSVRAWIAQMIDGCYPFWGFGMWALSEKATQVVIGYCGLSRFPNRCGSDEAELGFRLARPYWGNGYATEIAAATRDHGLYALRLRRILAMIHPDNVAALRVAQKIGMKFEREVFLAGYSCPDLLFVSQRCTAQ